MRHLTYLVGASIDGFVAGHDGSTDEIAVPQEFLRFLCEEYPETLPSPARVALGIESVDNQHFDTVVMGRNTFVPALEAGLSSAYPHLAQHVVSTTLDPAEHGDVRLHRGDPVDAIRALKQQDGLGIWLAGGPTLAASVADEIDRIVVKTYPTALGGGRSLFSALGEARPMALEWSAVLAGGVVMSSYAPRLEAPTTPDAADAPGSAGADDPR